MKINDIDDIRNFLGDIPLNGIAEDMTNVRNGASIKVNDTIPLVPLATARVLYERVGVKPTIDTGSLKCHVDYEGGYVSDTLLKLTLVVGGLRPDNAGVLRRVLIESWTTVVQNNYIDVPDTPVISASFLSGQTRPA